MVTTKSDVVILMLTQKQDDEFVKAVRPVHFPTAEAYGTYGIPATAHRDPKPLGPLPLPQSTR